MTLLLLLLLLLLFVVSGAKVKRWLDGVHGLAAVYGFGQGLMD
jgi:hypothetical protein